ncbi:MAG: hypothetical protein ACQEQX_03380 [Thermodesulfobacteriota bacterium]
MGHGVQSFCHFLLHDCPESFLQDQGEDPMTLSRFRAAHNLLSLLALICLLHVTGYVHFLHAAPNEAQALEQQPVQDQDVQWFKDEMKISDKYVDQQQGVLGISWAHFFTMIFLVLFLIAALAGMFIRYKRMQKLLAEISKEE